jgi:inner membrane protein involved in colicin E2 resistance
MNVRSKRIATLVMLAALSCVAMFGGVGCAADRATIDHRAAVMVGLADKINAGTSDDLKANAPYVAWTIENERRAAQNISDAYHWKSATYKYPASQPTTLPWTPVDDTNSK